MSDSNFLLQLLWTNDPVGQVTLLSILGVAVLSAAFVYQPLLARLLRLRALDRKLGNDRTRPVGEDLEDRRIELDAAFLGSLIADEWADFQRRWHDSVVVEADGTSEEVVECAPVRLLDTVSESLLPRDLRRTLLTCLPGIFLMVGVIGAGISLGLAVSAEGAAFGVHLAAAIAVLVWGVTFAGLASLTNRLLEAAFVRVGESLDKAAERAFACVSASEVATRTVRSQRDVVKMLPGEVSWVAGEITRVLDEGLVRIEQSTAGAATLVSEEQRGAVREIVQELSTSVRRGVERHLGGLNAALQRTVEHQDQITGGLAHNYERMVETANAIAPVSKVLEEAAGAVATASASISDSANDVRPALGQLVDTGKALEQASAHIHHTQELSAGSIDEIRASLIHAAEAVAEQRQLVDVGLRETRSMVESLRGGLGDELSESLAEIDQSLSGAVAQLQSVIEDSNRTVVQLNAPIQSAEGIARETYQMLERASADVAGLGQWLNQVIEPVTATLAQIDERTGEVNRVLEGFTGQGQVLEQSVDALKGSMIEESRDLKDASAQLTERLEKAADALASYQRNAGHPVAPTQAHVPTESQHAETVVHHVAPAHAAAVSAAATEVIPPRPSRAGGFIQRATRVMDASSDRQLAAERAHQERVARRRERKERAAQAEAEASARSEYERQAAEAARIAEEERQTEVVRAAAAEREAEALRAVEAEREAEVARIAAAEREVEELRLAQAEREAELARLAKIAEQEREAEEARLSQAEREADELRVAQAEREAASQEHPVDAPVAADALEHLPMHENAPEPTAAASGTRLSSLIGGAGSTGSQPTPASLLSHEPDWTSYSHSFRKKSSS